jgi:hypothetical protein
MGLCYRRPDGYCLGLFLYLIFSQKTPAPVNLGFIDRSRYFFIQVAPQLS